MFNHSKYKSNWKTKLFENLEYFNSCFKCPRLNSYSGWERRVIFVVEFCNFWYKLKFCFAKMPEITFRVQIFRSFSECTLNNCCNKIKQHFFDRVSAIHSVLCHSLFIKQQQKHIKYKYIHTIFSVIHIYTTTTKWKK